MKMSKKIVVLCLVLVISFKIQPYKATQAVSKPDKPVISINTVNNNTDVKITIKETSGAKGYKIVMKTPSDTKYKKLKTLKKDGSSIRTYTVKNLTPGKYSFKVKAYTKSGKKTVYSSYSKAKTISVNILSAFNVDVEINKANFPDNNFRDYLIEYVDLDKNGKLSESERNINILDISYKEIKDLKGIEYFIKITELRCHHNKLASLDISNNTAIEILFCNNNQLTTLDISKNTALTHLDCGTNELKSLDVSKNLALVALLCYWNQLTSLDISQNNLLERLNASHNQLTSLDVSENTALYWLWCAHNLITYLDLKNCDHHIDVDTDYSVKIIR